MTLMLAAPALAVELQQDPPIPSTATGFEPGDGDCVGVQSGQVLWHFILTDGNGTEKLTVTFQNSPTQTVSSTKITGNATHFDVWTGPDTLLSASTDSDAGKLVLSHICDGGPPPEVPESPASVLLVLSAGLLALGFAGWKMRRSASAV
jgi:hypothetical protein